MDTKQNAVPALETHCCIAGCGPAGAMLGFLLARRGIDVVVLEKHGDFLRDFRGDTIHPSTLAVMQELGLADELLSLPYMTAPVLNVWTHRVSSRWPTSAVSRRPGPISPFFHNGIS